MTDCICQPGFVAAADTTTTDIAAATDTSTDTTDSGAQADDFFVPGYEGY